MPLNIDPKQFSPPKHCRRGQELNLDRNNLPGDDRLRSVARVKRPIGFTPCFIDAPMCYAEPTPADDVSTKAERPFKAYMPAPAKLAHCYKQVGIRASNQLDVQLQLHRSRELDVCRHGQGKAYTSFRRVETCSDGRFNRLLAHLVRPKPEPRPLYARWRPTPLHPHGMHTVSLFSNFNANGISVSHPVLLTFEEAIKEAILQRKRFRRVINRPLSPSMCKQVPVLGRDASISLEAAARVKPLIREARANQCWNFDALEIGHQAGPKVVPVRMCELRVAQRTPDPAGPFRHRRPKGHKAVLANTARIRCIVVDVAPSLPTAYRRERCRAKRSHLPLADCQIRDAIETHLSLGPGLSRRPLDCFRVVACLFVRQQRPDAFGSPESPQVEADDDIAARNPITRVRGHPCRVGRIADQVRLPYEPVTLERKVAHWRPPWKDVLTVGVRAHNNGELARAIRPKHIRPKRGPVPQRNRDIAIKVNSGSRRRHFDIWK